MKDPSHFPTEVLDAINYSRAYHDKIVPLRIETTDTEKNLFIGLNQGADLDIETEDTVRFILSDYTINFEPVNVSETELKDFYRLSRSRIRKEAWIHHCQKRVSRCPLKWSNLENTDNDLIKFCGVCKNEVFLVTSGENFEKLSKEKKCVALPSLEDIFDPLSQW